MNLSSQFKCAGTRIALDSWRDKQLGNGSWNRSSKHWINWKIVPGQWQLLDMRGESRRCRLVMRSSRKESLRGSRIGSSSMVMCWCRARLVSQIE